MDKNYIDAYWACNYFGCTISDFRNQYDIVCPHFYLLGYNGVFIMNVYNKFVISAPEDKISIFSQIINRGNDLFDYQYLQSQLKDKFGQFIGPSWIGYPMNNKSCENPENTQILNKTDNKRILVFKQLRPCCDQTEWLHSGIDEASEYIAVRFLGDIIVSVASYEKWGEKVAHIGIITHPKFRNKGYAKNVLSLLTEFINQQGLIPQYRTLCMNIPAIRTAVKCGYAEYASHVSIRFK